MAGIDCLDLLLQYPVFVADLRRLLLIVKGAACQSGQFKQAGKGVVLP